MGCQETKDKNLPRILCYIEVGNEEQKNYFFRLRDNFCHHRRVAYKILSKPGIPFCVQFINKGQSEPYKIQDILDYSEEAMNNSLQKMYKILDGVFDENDENKFGVIDENDENQFGVIDENDEKQLESNGVKDKTINLSPKEEIKLKEINERQINFNNNSLEVEYKKNNENIELIEKNAEKNGLSKAEIIREVKRTQLLEDMSAMGTIMKNKIKKEISINPDKFVTKEEIIQKEESDKELYALYIYSKFLESQGMTTSVEKENDEKDENDINTAETSLQFLVNGMSNKNKYNLHFELGKEKNEIFLSNEKKRREFHDKLRKKLSREFNIKEEDIIITFPRKGCYQVTIIFKSQDFELSEEELLDKFKNEKEELGKLKKIEKGIILDGCFLRKSMLDPKGNNRDGGWAPKGEKRGGEEYLPPYGWIGYGLRVEGVYGDNTWIGMNNVDGEWCVAYHGVARGQESKEVARIAGIIPKSGFKPSTWGKATNEDDIRHPGEKCGLGVYCSPDISYIEKNDYAGIIEFNGKKYKCALMLRVNPKKIRQSSIYNKEYILEPTTDEIRPYRILLKEFY